MAGPGRTSLFLFLMGALLARSPAQAHDDPHADHPHRPDWIRLLSATVFPDPYDPTGGPLILTTRTAVRPVAGLAALDDRDPDHRTHGFRIRVFWTVSQEGRHLATVVQEQDLEPPFETQALPASKGKGTRDFILVESHLTWNGRDEEGGDVPEGTCVYRVIVEFLREDLARGTGAGGTPIVELDDSEPVDGEFVLIYPRPDPPEVDPVPDLTNERVLILSGRKPPETALLVDGTIRVATDAGTTWNTSVTLLEGLNTLSLQTRNPEGYDSVPVVVETRLDTIPPVPPAVEPVEPVSSSSAIRLSGSKDAGSSIRINGVEVVPADGSTTWEIEYQGQEGLNELVVTSVDLAGNESVVAGPYRAGLVTSKPVIGQLASTPAEVHHGDLPRISYRLHAEEPPEPPALLEVFVRVRDGSRIVVDLVPGALQPASPAGELHELTWDLRDAGGDLVEVNRSYVVEVAALHAPGTTGPVELIDANPKGIPLSVLGSRAVTSPDGLLELVYRPEGTDVTILARPVFEPAVVHRLTGQGLWPVDHGYEVSAEGPLEGSALGLWKLDPTAGPRCRPALWSPDERRWLLITDADWDPGRHRLGFELPRPGLLLAVTPADGTPPRVASVLPSGDRLEMEVLDPGEGLDLSKLRCLVDGEDRTGGLVVEPLRGSRRLRLRLEGTGTGRVVDLHLEDRAGNSSRTLRRLR